MRAFRVNVRAPPAPVIRPKSTELMFTFGSFHSGVLSRLIASKREIHVLADLDGLGQRGVDDAVWVLC